MQLIGYDAINFTKLVFDVKTLHVQQRLAAIALEGILLHCIGTANKTCWSEKVIINNGILAQKYVYQLSTLHILHNWIGSEMFLQINESAVSIILWIYLRESVSV